MLNKPDFAFARAVVDSSVAASRPPTRQCPACGRECLLFQGRWSKKFMWTHEFSSSCEYDTLRRVMHDTQEAAMEGEMFK